jgi:hypothetical protein
VTWLVSHGSATIAVRPACAHPSAEETMAGNTGKTPGASPKGPSTGGGMKDPAPPKPGKGPSTGGGAKR